jgi:DNA-directed RNA polymerase specialized sigma24 family protein
MNGTRTPQSLTLRELAQECAKQEATYRRLGEAASDPRFCYELFCQAIVKRDEAAWSLIYAQYEPQIVRWIRQNQAFRSTGQGADYFVSEVFAKFWHAVTPGKFTKQLNTLGAVLLYLKRCVASTLYSYQRTRKWESMCCALEEVHVEVLNSASRRPAERHLVQRTDAEQLWELVKSLLRNEREKVIVENVFLLGKKARQVQTEYPHLFPDVKSVYRTKENLLKRFRRNRNLRNWLPNVA